MWLSTPIIKALISFYVTTHDSHEASFTEYYHFGITNIRIVSVTPKKIVVKYATSNKKYD